MTDQPKWMPSDAWVEKVRQDCGPVAAAALPFGHLRTAFQIAVEKALAEREATYLQDFLGWKEQEEARHKREVIEARIATLEKYAYCSCDTYGYDCEPCLRLDALRAELAALEVKP